MTGMLTTLLVITAIATPLLIWLVPNRRADLERIHEVRKRRESGRTRELTAIDAEIAELARRRDQLMGEDR